MFSLLALRNLLLRPWRSLLLLVGFSLGVAVMIVLLSVGEALVAQARQERLVGGGEITVLPEGIDVEVMKTGGLGGMYFSIDHARFVYRQLLTSPRLARWVRAAAPQIEGKLLYLRTGDGREIPVRATGEIPSLTAAVGAAPALAAGAWGDDSLDRRWRDPTDAELRHLIDHFHLPPDSVRGDPTWAEWHYFNVLSADRRRWAFVTLSVGGRIPGGPWGGQVLVTLHEQDATGGERARRFVSNVSSSAVRFSTTQADLAVGGSSVTVLPDGRYAVRAHATADPDDPETERGSAVDVDLVVAPQPGAYFPGAALAGGEVVSGYVVPALRADATGRVCVRGGTAPARCEAYDGAQSYHDHNWGTWRGVTWQWGSARAGPYGVLYGRVQPADSEAASQPLFVYVTDSSGFLALFRPRAIRYVDGRTIRVGGRALRVPASAVMEDARGDDTLRIELAIEAAAATDTRRPLLSRGDTAGARRLATPYFIQMKGLARLDGRIGGRPIHAQGPGFFETYR